MAALQITENNGAYRFSGDTYNFKDLIKALPGAKWVPAEKVWVTGGGDLTAIKDRMAMLKRSTDAAAQYAAKYAYRRKPREEWTKDEWDLYCCEWTKRGSVGKCCGNAKAFQEYEQGPICWRCEKHGVTGNNFTGD